MKVIMHKDFKANQKEDYGEIKMHLFVSFEKNTNTMNPKQVFFSHNLKTFLNIYNLLNICSKIPLASIIK